MPTPSPSNPESVFADYLARREAGELLDFDALCRAHPDDAGVLCRLHEDWERANAALELARGKIPTGSSFAERLKNAYGEGADPHVQLDASPSASPGAASDELVKRLAAHTPMTTRYTFEGELARGGMGAILRVWDEDLRRHLAMKVVLGRDESTITKATPPVDSKQLARFLEEAQVTGQLDHPGIVPVHELGLDSNGRVYFTMKLVKGRDLKSIFDIVVGKSAVWNETRALGVLIKVCEAMAYAHSKGVIHRDLKPANVMVGNFGEVFVMDWGLARVLGRKDTHDIRIKPEFSSSEESVKTERRDDREEAADSPIVTMDGDVMGTPAYMAPEQARGEIEKLTPRSDVYAIGAMLYHLLARQMPYITPGARVSNRTILAMVLQGPPRPVTSIRSEVPPELVAICDRAMARDPDMRYVDTMQMADDVQAYLEGRVVQAYRTGALVELQKWVQRNSGTASALAAAVLVTISAFIIIAYVQSTSNTVLATANDQTRRARDDALAANEDLRRSNRALHDEQDRETELNHSLEVGNEQLRNANQALTKARDDAHANELRATHQSYVANIIAADASLRSHEVAEAKRRLAACEPKMRGWEWRHLYLDSDTSSLTLRGHETSVLSVAFSPDGSRIASGDFGGTVRVWASGDGSVLSTYKSVGSPISTVAFSPDGARLIAGSGNGLMHMWNVQSGEKLLSKKESDRGGWVYMVAFSPDGSRVASTSYGSQRIWDSRLEQCILVTKVDARVRSIAFSADSARIASGMRNAVCVRDVQSGVAIQTLTGHDAEVSAVSFSPDGRYIASGSEDKTVRVWDTQTGSAPLVLIGHEGRVSSIAFSPDGSRIASGSGNGEAPGGPLGDKTVRVWDAQTGRALLVLRGHDGDVSSIAFSPDGSRILSGSKDNTLRLWNAWSGEACLVLHGHSRTVRSIAFSPDGSRIASGSWDNTVRVWDAMSGGESLVLRGHTSCVTSIAFSPDGTHLVSGSGVQVLADSDNTVRVWDTTSGAEVLTLRGHESHNSEVASVAFSPNGLRIVSGSSDKTVRVWDARTGELALLLLVGDARVTSVAYSPDGSRIACGSLDGAVHEWDATSGEPLAVLHGLQHQVIRAIAYSPDGLHLASGGGILQLWDACAGQLAFALPGHDGLVDAVAFNADGSRLASGSWDNTVRVWDVDTGEELLALREPAAHVSSVAFSPDGSRIAAAVEDSTVRVWETSASAIHDADRKALTETRFRAERLVASLFSQCTFVNNVVERLRADSSLTVPVREYALRLASLSVDDFDAIDHDIWGIVSVSGRPESDYKRALQIQEVVHTRNAGNLDYVRTLGVALYRVGEYAQALPLLQQVDELDRKRPGDLAFLSMTYYHLGDEGKAKDALSRLSQLVRLKSWKDDVTVSGWLEEATRLIAPDAASGSEHK